MNDMDDDVKLTQGNDERVNIADPFAKKLIASYLEKREADLEILRSSLAECDLEYIRLKGHNLSGSGSAYGLDRISEIGKALEAAAIDQDIDTISEQIDVLEHYIHNLHIT